MKHFYIAIILLLSCGQNPQKTFKKDHPQLGTKVETKLKTLYETHQLKGDLILGIVTEKGLVYSYTINKDSLRRNASDLSHKSPFYLASHTKAFTGTLLQILAEKGIIDLNKSLYHYLPEIDLQGEIDTKSVTVRQLLNHTQGFTSNMFVWKTAYLGYTGGNMELIDAINTNFRTDPSHQFRYSNIGPILAAMIIEKVTGNSWKKEMKQRIFEPLQMNQTSSNVSDFKHEDIRPSIVGNTRGFYKTDLTMSAAGGTISTLNDLAKWLQFNIRKKPTLVNSFDELHQPTVAQDRTFFTYKRFGYSLSWDLATYQTDTILTRFGGYGGISFHASFIPSKKIGVIAFSNEEKAFYLPHLAANYAYNLILHPENSDTVFAKEEKEFTVSVSRIVSRQQPKSEEMAIANKTHFLGTYKNESGWSDISLFQNNGKLMMRWGELNGLVYKDENPKRPFVASLGALTRSFNIENDTLKTGSLIYIKK